MAQVTVKQLSEVVGATVERLLEQLKDAGIEVAGADSEITDEQKFKLLDHLRNSHGKTSAATAGKGKITLKRRSTASLKSSGSKAVNVEVRKKRSISKVSDSAPETDSKEKEKAEIQALMAEKEAREAVRAEAEVVAIEKSKEAAKQREEEAIAKKEAEVKARIEAEQQAKVVANAKARGAAKAEASKTTGSSSSSDDRNKNAQKPAAKGRGKGDTRYGRKELHVASGKKGRGKKTSRKVLAAQNAEAKHAFEKPVEKIVYDVDVPETIKVSDLALKMSMKAGEMIKTMMTMGVMATINQVIDQDTAILIVEELGHKAIASSADDRENSLLASAGDELHGELPRPPVVTIMGHVDHGKTSLLDHIREAKVAHGEAGGITQHIGAYHVETDKGVITFLDTPGHAAFTSMRARGAQATDIVILVVAADDGVMPQTIEAVQHAKAAGVPLIIAVNKIDLEAADPDRVKTELGSHDVIPEDWGGENIFVNVSAKTGEGIDDLLEAINLTAEVLEYTAPAKGPAQGIVVEATLDKGRGVTTTVLVQKGGLRKGDILLAGQEYGRVRAMFDENGKQIDEAGPSIPVVVLGLSGTPAAGDQVQVMTDEKTARELAENRHHKVRDVKFAAQQQAKLDSLFTNLGKGEVKFLNILLKADVQGSLEAIKDSLMKLAADNDEVDVAIVGSGVGGINDTDISLAAASNAVVFGFNVRADAAARKSVAERGVDMRYYSVIYDLIGDVKDALTGMLSAKFREEIIGLAEVKDIFRSPKFGLIAGSIVTEGTIKKSQPIRVLRDDVVIYEGELESLRRFKDMVDEVKSGTECGIGVKNYNDVKIGDQIEVFERVEMERVL
ncbi:MAG: translation initiation factor IF-2 [endosymbiont of Galathealinum brachiosum]|uniref:Translation initiation factor IF-2 n=1 Tax=endosymbiont of Galathealinum brachiosum TaxID=2200906 RepID=A0A370D8F4_9GAMM|nr:MAG: translation initiation factor IF-2 [endosymbiont of Galathealinum brachiosum]